MRKQPKVHLTPFERETERRRREMKAHLSKRVSKLPTKLRKIILAYDGMVIE